MKYRAYKKRPPYCKEKKETSCTLCAWSSYGRDCKGLIIENTFLDRYYIFNFLKTKDRGV